MTASAAKPTASKPAKPSTPKTKAAPKAKAKAKAKSATTTAGGAKKPTPGASGKTPAKS